MTVAHNIYFHVPFCKSKCRYCAFFSQACANPDWDEYTRKIVDEIEYWAEKLGNISVPTVFFGGGTPSLIPIKNFEHIIKKLNNRFSLAANAEITLEANPGTIDNNKLKDFISLGINRLSVGIQSLDDQKLKFLGRTHNVDCALRTIEYANKMNIRVSGDFIYGLPGENIDDIIKTCSKINKLGLTHCSMYELTIEEGTPLANSNPIMPDNDTMANMYLAIQNTLSLPRYEVSNYATPGNECQHNKNIWDGQPYIGIGMGAAGRIFHNNTWYEQRGNYAEFKPISNKERAIEKIITGLRTTQGVCLTDDVKNAINMNKVQQMNNLLSLKENRLCVTEAGILVLDDIVVKIVR